MVGIDAERRRRTADRLAVDSVLDLRHGIGVAAQQHIDLLSALRTASAGNVASESSSTSQPSARPSAQQLHDLLKDDLAIRDRLEPVIAQCNSTFMTDFDRLIASYRLPRALAYANRRLCDEIAVLRQIGVAMGLWTITEERRERVTVPVLQSGSSAAAGEWCWMISRIAPQTSSTLVRPVAPRRKGRSTPATVPCLARIWVASPVLAVPHCSITVLVRPVRRMARRKTPSIQSRPAACPNTASPIGVTLTCPVVTWTTSWASTSKPRARIRRACTS